VRRRREKEGEEGGGGRRGRREKREEEGEGGGRRGRRREKGEWRGRQGVRGGGRTEGKGQREGNNVGSKKSGVREGKYLLPEEQRASSTQVLQLPTGESVLHPALLPPSFFRFIQLLPLPSLGVTLLSHSFPSLLFSLD
jgi:hypothetical protein